MILYVKMKEGKRAVKTAMYHSPFGDMELDYEGGAVTALKMAGKEAEGKAPEGLALTLSGVKAGDRVVTEGAYQVKLASATNAIPAHSHEH